MERVTAMQRTPTFKRTATNPRVFTEETMSSEEILYIETLVQKLVLPTKRFKMFSSRRVTKRIRYLLEKAVIAQVIKQNGLRALSGHQLLFVNKHDHSMVMDRIDIHQDYVEVNFRLIVDLMRT